MQTLQEWLQPFYLTLLLGAGLLLLLAAYSDLRHFKIPNLINILLLALFPLAVLAAPTPPDWPQHLLVFTAVLLAGLLMFSSNLAGAGDVKFLAVLALWAGPQLVAVLLFVTALGGGVVALAVLARALWQRRAQLAALPRKELMAQLVAEPIPYGVAIAAGGLVCLARLAQPALMS